MSELDWVSRPERPSLRRAVRHRVREFDRPCRVAAENFLAVESRMDLLAVGLEGELVSLRIGIEEDDAQLLTTCLSDLVWLRARRHDLAKLAPDLGIEPSAPPRAVLLCDVFHQDTRRAVEALPDGTVDLIGYRCFRRHGQLEVVLDPSGRAPDARASERTDAPSRRFSRDALDFLHPEESALPPSESLPKFQPSLPVAPTPGSDAGCSTAPRSRPGQGFRTGLVDADLRTGESRLIEVD